MSPTESVLNTIRERQQPGDRADTLRFVLETASPKSPADLVRAVQQTCRVDSSVRPLFQASAEDQELANFFLLEIPAGKTGTSQSQHFELSYHLLDTLQLRSCEPDLETEFAHAGDTRADTESGFGGVLGCRVDKAPPNDPRWALKSMRVTQAWDIEPPAGGKRQGEGILIGQIDTGINEHKELEDGALDLRHGANFVEGGATLPIDPLVKDGLADNPGHGIATASVVVSRETHLVTGVAPKAKLLPVRAIRSVIRVTQATVAEGVDYARRQGCHVITMSLGGLPSLALRAAIRRAVRDNIIVVAAAGNCVRTVAYPARFQDCIAIAGINVDDLPWQGSCRGSAIDVSAPAELVYRADRGAPEDPVNDANGEGQGTSFAVALTAGVAALWLAHQGRDRVVRNLRPGQTVQELFRRLLRGTARVPDHGQWDFSEFGAGIVDARGLLDSQLTASDEEFARSATSETEIASAIGDIAAEATGMRPDDLGMSLAERSRFGLEIAALALNKSGGSPLRRNRRQTFPRHRRHLPTARRRSCHPH